MGRTGIDSPLSPKLVDNLERILSVTRASKEIRMNLQISHKTLHLRQLLPRRNRHVEARRTAFLADPGLNSFRIDGYALVALLESRCLEFVVPLLS